MVELVLLASVGVEWLLYSVPGLWRARRVLVGVALVLAAFGASGVLWGQHDVWAMLTMVVGLFRLFNHLRIAEGRMNAQYLLRVTRRTGLLLGALQIALLALVYWSVGQGGPLLLPLSTGQAALAVMILTITLRNIIKSRAWPLDKHYADSELPTVTVAIPARNETTDLEECLRSVLANTYPKLEVLVLDDCSQDKTAEIIRSFAHDGVRFIKGVEPQEDWLAKNQAYDRLADEATGELILFCGVDVRFGAEAIRAMVATLQARNKDMISLLPRRLSNDASAAIIQPMRYWWELALPRRWFNRPPVLSTCWMIRRKKLKALGGFQAVRHAIIPEGYFARELVKTDGYSFLRSDEFLDVCTLKSRADQRETTIRMRYPQLRRRPEWIMVFLIVHTLFLLGPFAVLASGFWLGFGMAQLLAAGACALLIATHVAVMQVTNPTNVLVAVFNFPVAIVVDLALNLASMYLYEFSQVDWKGRNICIPVMHVVPHLPPMSKHSR
jgi:hypothetical protein